METNIIYKCENCGIEYYIITGKRCPLCKRKVEVELLTENYEYKERAEDYILTKPPYKKY